MAQIIRRGSKWRARVRRKGCPDQSATFSTKARAERWARDIEGRVDQGTLSPVDGEARRITLREALDRYAAEVTPAKRGKRQELARIERWKAHELADRVLAAVRPHDIAQARNALSARGLGANSIRLELAMLSHLFNTARKEWGLAGLPNPVREVSKPSTRGSERDRRLQGDEEQRLLEAAASLAWWVRPAIVLAIETGMRRGELAALRWDCIDLQAGVARLPMTKNGDPRQVPLSPASLAELQAMPRNMGGRVLGVNADEVTHRFNDACKAAGIAGLRFHDLRHECASRLFERGLTIAEVATVTGHRTWSMLRRYVHLKAADIAAKLAGRKPG